jgi:hypothetical protein
MSFVGFVPFVIFVVEPYVDSDLVLEDRLI